MKKEIFYEIYDGRNNSLMAENTILKAKSGRKALDEYLKGTDIEVKRSGAREVIFCVTPIFYEEGRKYKYRNRVWYAIL